MNIKALQLCSHFALQPNMLGYCGQESAPAKLVRCIQGGKCTSVQEELKQFIVLNPYLQTIAEITGKDPFSYEVVEAYWLGNDILKHIESEHYNILLKHLIKQGVPEFLIQEIIDKKPQKFIPIHLFNILHIGVGKASGSVPFNLESINNCMIRWGKVLTNPQINRQKIQKELSTSSILNNYQLIKVETVEIGRKKDMYVLHDVTKEFAYYPDVIGEIANNDEVALHWGWIAKKLTKEEKQNLVYWTNDLLNSITIA